MVPAKKKPAPSPRQARCIAELEPHGVPWKGTLSTAAPGPRQRTEALYDETRAAPEEASVTAAGASDESNLPTGRRVRIYWHGLKKWHAGVVKAPAGPDFTVLYDSQGEHTENLAAVQWEYEARQSPSPSPSSQPRRVPSPSPSSFINS